MAKRTYPDDLRARVRAQLEAGAAVVDVARAEGLPGPLVRGWATAWRLHHPVDADREAPEPPWRPCELNTAEVREARAMLRQGLSVGEVTRRLHDSRRTRRALGWGEANPDWTWQV